MKRVLFDNSGRADIPYYDVDKLMGIRNDQLKPFPKPLMGIESHNVMPKGVIMLPLTLVEEPRMMTTMVEFMVIDAHFPYNALLGRSS